MPDSLELALQPDPRRLTLGCFLDDVAARHGSRVALRQPSALSGAGRDLSYAELHTEAQALARGLVGLGVVKGARVAVLMSNRAEWVAAAFAVGLVGAVLVPVNTFATPDELDYILRHSDASLLLMQRELLSHDFLADLVARHPEVGQGEPGRILCEALPHLRRVVCLELEEARGAVEPWSVLAEAAGPVSGSLLNALAAEVHPTDDALLIYTSGTTAHPKGVFHRQRSPVIQSWRFAEDMGLVPDDRILTAQPMFWTAGIVMSLGASLAAGAMLILEPVFSATRFLDLIEQESVTTLHAWPHQEKSMAEESEAASRELSSLRKIEFSSPLASLVGLAADEWGTYGSYGMSETFTLASSLPAHTDADLRKQTSGRALPGMELRIVDPETGLVLEDPSVPGEIAVRGATLMTGYYKTDRELYFDADGFFHTQDGGFIDAEGFLHWTGRLSNLIKTGGANVSPLEIENLTCQFPEVHIAAALGIPHPTLGEAIVLCVVRAQGAQIEEADILSRLRERLSAYKLPRKVLFPDADAIEYTANQKLQVEPLRTWAQAELSDGQVEIAGFVY